MGEITNPEETGKVIGLWPTTCYVDQNRRFDFV